MNKCEEIEKKMKNIIKVKKSEKKNVNKSEEIEKN